MTSMCNPQALNVLVSRKEFRIIPTPIFQHIQMSADLPLESKFLWTVLWELCSPNSHYEKNLTWGFLAKRLNRSPASIRRWAKHLIKFGYLKVSEVFSADGSQLPSKFQIGVPNNIAKKVWQSTPNRYVKPAAVVEESCDNVQSGSELKDSECVGISEEEAFDTGVNDLDAGTKEEFLESSKSDGSEAGSLTAKPAISPETNKLADACSYHADDHAENETTVLKSGVANPISKLNRTLRKLEGSSRKGSKSSLTAISNPKRLNVQGQPETAYEREIREITERAFNLRKTAQKRGGEGAIKSVLQGAIKSGTQESNPQKQDNKNSAALIERVKSDLMIRLGTGYDFKTLSEEVALSIEIGSFQKFTYQKAINVAVKLVKGNRWRKPRVKIYA